MCPDPFPDIRDLLDRIKEKGIRLAMVTGKGKHSTDISLKKFGLTSYFGIIETGSPTGPRKTDGIRQVLAGWPHLAKEEIIYVGDAPSDIIASRDAGIAVVGAGWAPTAEPEALLAQKPDQLFYTVKDFSDWLLPRI